MPPHLLMIGETLVSSDLVTVFFACDLDACRGACCVEGESGAPVTEAEERAMERAFPLIRDLLRPEAAAVAEKEGLAYTDQEGDRVTALFRGRECLFACPEASGGVRCAFEKARSEGRKTGFLKPLSCHLYPVRLSRVGETDAVNYHRWKPICEPARRKGRSEGIRLYRFLKEPLIRAFGREWYDELEAAADLYLQQFPA